MHFNMKKNKYAGIFEWPSQTTEDVCAVSTILIQIKWNFQDYLSTIWASIYNDWKFNGMIR